MFSLEQGKGSKIFICKVANPQRYGVVVFKGNNIHKVEEKPKNPKSSYVVTGLYIYNTFNCIYIIIYCVSLNIMDRITSADII